MIQAMVTGNLGSDPDLRYSAGGNAFLRMNVASNGRTRTPEGEWVDETTWVRVTVLGQRAETIAQHLSKGMRVCAVGKLEAKPWTDQQGTLRAGLELIANEIEFQSQRQDDRQQRPQQARQQQQQTSGTAARGRPMSEAQAVHGGRPVPAGAARRGPTNVRGDVVDDDLPF